MVVGYGLAHRAPAPSYDGAPPFGIDAAGRAAGEGADAGGAVHPTYGGEGERRLEVAFRADETTRSPAVETRVDLGVRERRTSRPEGGVELERTFDDVAVSVTRDGESIDSQIVGQVESLLLGARAEVRLDSNGRVDGREWMSVTNPQVRQTLRVLKHAVVLATPRFRRGTINVGENWSYQFVPDAPVGGAVRSMEALAEIEAELVGVRRRGERRLAVIDREIEVSADGSVELEEGREYGFELSADGGGRALFDLERGRIAESRVELSRRLQLLAGPDRRSTRRGELRIVLREKATNETGDEE